MLTGPMLAKYGFAREPLEAGWFEDESFTLLLDSIQELVHKGRLIVITGAIGVGKTTSLEKIGRHIEAKKDVFVSVSYSIEKQKVSLQSLMLALILDLRPDDPLIITKAKQPEQRERTLRRILTESRKNIAMVIDEAHDLSLQTLVELKRLMEICKIGESSLSIVLVGHPRLRHMLKQSDAAQEIGDRAFFHEMRGITGREREFFEWMMKQCLKEGVHINDIFTTEAVDFIVSMFSTPLQMQCFVGRAIEEAWEMDQKQISVAILQEAVFRDVQNKESKLVRMGYNSKRLAEYLNVRETEVKTYFVGKLPSDRHKEIEDKILRLGLLAKA